MFYINLFDECFLYISIYILNAGFLYIIFKESHIMQYQVTSKFGDTKNLPNQTTVQKEIKQTKSKDKGDLTNQ